MNRRTFLTGIGTIGVANVAGCLGYTVESEEDVEGREARIQELEAEVDDLEAEADGLETEVDDLETEIDDLEGEVDDLEADLGDHEDEIDTLETKIATLQAEKVSVLYAQGHARIESANESMDDGEVASELDDWRRASGFWLQAEGKLEGAHSAFGAAADAAQEGDLPSVVDPIEEAESWAHHMTEGCLHTAYAYLWLSRGARSTASHFLSKAETSFAEGSDYDVVEPSELDAKLGL